MRRTNEANKQLQCWPTPQMFVRRAGGPLTDLIAPALELSAFAAIVGQLADAGTEQTTSGLALSAMIVNGKQPVTVSETATSGLALSAFVAVTAQIAPAQTDTATSGLSLSAFVAVTAQIAPSQSDTATSGLALSAFIV